MQRVLISALAALALLVFIAPDASAMRLRLDPGGNGNAAVTSLYQGDLGHPIAITWQSCTNNGIPGSFHTGGYVACLALNNLTGSPISSLVFQFTVPQGLVGQTLDCSSDGVYLATSTSCPSGSLTLGEVVTFSYSGLPPIPTSRDFFIGADGLANVADYPGITATASVPEPGEMGLFGLGLLVIGILGYGAERRRRGSRALLKVQG